MGQLVAGLSPELIALLVSLGLAWNGLLIWGIHILIKRSADAHERRLAHMEQTMNANSEEYRRLERDISGMRLEVAQNYVKRDDFIRETSVIEARFETVSAKLDRLLGGRGNV